jgi:glycosyltransferase involved in cell wall biosynthesis
VHVGINALFLDPGRSSGTETYLRGLVPALAREFPDLRLTVVTTRRGAAALRREGWTEFCSVAQLPCDEGERARRTVAEQLAYPLLGRRRGWDVLHSLASVGPVWTLTPTVVTVHDVTFFHHRTFGLATTFGMRVIVRHAARSADALVAVSEAARDDVAATLGIPAERFAVVPNGAGRPPELSAASGDALGLAPSARVVLCVAALRPHKNQELLVRALPLLPEDVVVVAVGHLEGYERRLEDLARELGVAHRLRVAGYVSDAELEALWRRAACAAFPTRAEGFGLPVIEALARGVPVACADLPVLREVGGDLVHPFGVDDPAAAAAAIAAAMEDGRAREQGPRWAERFTWEQTARGTYAAYERAVAASSAARRLPQRLR